MATTQELCAYLAEGAYDETFSWLYPGVEIAALRARYQGAVKQFEQLYGVQRDVLFVSAPGRTEIGGNHTDHQRGKVLAASVNLDVICVVSANEEKTIRIQSAGYQRDEILLDNLAPQPKDEGKASAMIRGVADWLSQKGHSIGGLDAYTTSDVLSGSGLSSSAAFEVAVGNMLNYLYNDGKIGAVDLAIAGQYAENVHFGKPSGLMDQMASSVGGFVEMDFADPDHPVVVPVEFDFAHSGYALCIVDTKGSHADLTPDYAAIPAEMSAVAGFFEKKYLREVEEAGLYRCLGQIREKLGDRAVLRAMHFFSDHARVPLQAEALRQGNFSEFLRLIIASGRSSFSCLQNVFSSSNPQEQGLSVALALSERLLSEKNGGWRVHGGGFAGTIQAFVPQEFLKEYKTEMENVFGADSCHVLSVRPTGGTAVTPELGRR